MSGTASHNSIRWWGPSLTLLTLAFVMARLGGSSLWSDEAWPALLGLSILDHGVPRVAFGGFVIHWIPTDARDGLWVWDGWLQSYLSAAGEMIFGRTALGARFFHAMAGALIPWAAYPLFRAMSSRRGVAEASSLLTALSVPLLIHIRQARYYPEGILLTIVVLRAYHAGLRSRPRAMLGLVLASVLLFHANFTWFMLVGAALAAHLLLLRPPVQVAMRLAAAGLVACAIVAPFAIWARVWARRISELGTAMGPKDPYFALAHARHTIFELNLHVVPFVLLLLAGAAASGRGRPLRTLGCLLGLVAFPIALSGPYTGLALWVFAAVLILFALFGLAVLLAETRKPAEDRGWMPGTLVGLLCVAFVAGFAITSIYPFFRYVTPIVPLLIFLSVQSAFTLLRKPALTWSAVVLLAATNALSVWPIRMVSEHLALGKLAARGRSFEKLGRENPPAWLGAPNLGVFFFYEGWKPEAPPSLEVRSSLAAFLEEITHPFQGPIDAIAGYLNAHKRPGDRFFVTYGAYPIAFHTGLVPAEYDPRARPPRWVCIRTVTPLRNIFHDDREEVKQWAMQGRYEEIVLDAVDTQYQNREEPDLHLFRTAREGPRVKLLRQID